MKFRYKKIAMTVSMIVMGIGMITLSTKVPGADDSERLKQIEADQQEEEQKDSVQAEDNGEMAAAEQKETADQAESTPDVDAVETVAQDKGLEKNAYPAVNELIANYMNAKLECDESRLAELVDDVTYLDMTDIQRRTERIEEYVTIDCYTLAGPEEDSYMVYVYSEVKVTNVDTLASGLDGFYVKTGKDGKLTITMGDLPSDISEKLAENAEREDVKQLIADVNAKFVAEVSGDEKLAEYYEELSIVDVLEEEQSAAADSADGSAEE